MKNQTTIHILFALVAFSVSLTFSVDYARADACLSPQETRQAIAEGRAKHLAAIKEAASKIVRGDVISVKACEMNGRLVYQLVTLSRDGAVSQLVLDAKSGQLLSGGGR